MWEVPLNVSEVLSLPSASSVGLSISEPEVVQKKLVSLFNAALHWGEPAISPQSGHDGRDSLIAPRHSWCGPTVDVAVRLEIPSHSSSRTARLFKTLVYVEKVLHLVNRD